MPEAPYDYDAPWEYEFPVPAVDLSRTETAVTRPFLTKCVGVDGRRKGSLRRFPGFKLIRDLSGDISGLANIVRFWYVSIQKGSTPDVIRGFVVLADSSTATFQALYLVAYDTDTGAWISKTLEDFAVTDHITGVRVLGSWLDDRSEISAAQLGGADYVSARGSIWAHRKTGSSTRGMVLDAPTGRLIRVLSDSPSVALNGGAYHSSNNKFYSSTLTTLQDINLDTGGSTEVGTYSPVKSITDLAYDKTGNILWGVEPKADATSIWQVNPSTAALSGEVVVAGGDEADGINVIAYDNTNNKLYGLRSRKKFTAGTNQDCKLYEINTGTGAVTEVFDFETNGFGEEGREPNGRNSDSEQAALVIPPGAGVIYILARQTNLYLELDLSSGPRTYDSVDVTSTWRYIYASFEAQGSRRGLNRSYYWDVDANDIGKRHSGFLSPPALEDSLVTSQTTNGVIGDDKRVSAAFRLVSRRHAIKSSLSKIFRVDTGGPFTDANHIRLEINQFNLPTDLALEDLDIEVYRTIGTDSALSVDEVDIMGNLYRESISSLIDKATTDTAFVFAGRSEGRFGNAESDRELSARIPYNFKLDHVGAWPRTALVKATDNQVFVVAKPYLGDDPSTRFVELSEKASWRVMWSPPEKYELESFRGAVTGEQYRFPNSEATIFSLEKVGDFIFACTDLGVIRFHQSGSYVAVNPLAFKWGILGRDAATAMGNRLVLATPIGLIAVDAPSMQEEGFGVVQRLLSSTEYWRADIASINVSYDAQLGALILFNPVQDEMYLLWPDTGAVTSLEDCPWIQGTEGVDPVNGGSPRSFWITSTGQVHTPDAEETADKKTMYGAATADTVNGTATGGTTTTLVDTGAAFGSAAKGFWVHFLSGDNSGSSRQISAVTGTQLTWTSALGAAIASDDRYAVAPIAFRVRGHQLPGVRSHSMFNRKIVVSMAANIDLLGGEDTSSNPNLRMIYKMYRHVGDLSPLESEVVMDEDVGQMYGAAPVQDTILFPEWVCLSSNLDFQLLGGRVSGKISTSGAISTPKSVT